MKIEKKKVIPALMVIALGIAVGIVVVSLVFYHISHKRIQFKVRFDK